MKALRIVMHCAAWATAAAGLVGMFAGCYHIPNDFTPHLGKLFIVWVALAVAAYQCEGGV